MRSRRGFLGLGAGALLAAALPQSALAALDDPWLVSYFWSRTLARVVEHRRLVARALGNDLENDLVVVSGRDGLWGLLEAIPPSDRDGATALAADRHRRLLPTLGGDEPLASAMPDRDYRRTHHVGYGHLPSEDEAKVRRAQIAERLGAELSAALVVQADALGWQPVLERYADAKSTDALARKHAVLLAELKIPTSVVADRLPAPGFAVEKPLPVVLPPAEARPAAASPEEKRTLELPATSTTALRDAINEHVQSLRHQGLIAPDETTSWYVQTLHDDRTWAAINAERSLQCASMVKPYVALAFLHRVQEGRIHYGDNSRAKLEAMIQYSSNTATNWAMTTLGGPAAVQQILAGAYGDLLPETSITELIPENGRTYRNRSSARDYVRFSRAMWRDELPRSAEMKRLMSLPGRDRLYTGAPSIPKCTEVMNKTGTTAQLCGDFGILVARTRDGKKIPYAIVGIIEKSCSAPAYGAWVTARTKVIRSVSDLAYQALREHYGLV